MWNILKQGAAEGIEEGVTSVLNNFADNLIMGDKSNFNILVSEYMNQGMDEKDAKKKAWMNMAGDIAFDMLGGFVSGEVHAGPLTSISYVKTQNQYAKTGSSIMDADGGVEALMNLANQVAGVSSAQMQSTLTSQIDKVSQNPTARNIGQLYTTVQAANNQAKTSAGQSNAIPQTMTNQTNTSINRADVAESLKGKGIPAHKIDTLAAAIVARVNGQQLNNTQRSVLSFELGRPSVQKVINELIQKKTRGIDSAQSNVYDKDDVVGGLENREEATLWDLAKQRVGADRSGVLGMLREIDSLSPEAFSAAQRRGLTSEVDVFGDNDYATVMEGSSLHQFQKAVPEEIYEGDAEVIKKNLVNKVKDIRAKMPSTNLSKRGNMAVADVDIPGIKNNFLAHSKINAELDKGADVADFSYLKPENERIFTSYVDDQYPRYHDTEAKILEDIASQITDPDVSGTINLYSQLPCCQSCSNIILEFRRMCPNIELNIFVE